MSSPAAGNPINRNRVAGTVGRVVKYIGYIGAIIVAAVQLYKGGRAIDRASDTLEATSKSVTAMDSMVKDEAKMSRQFYREFDRNKGDSQNAKYDSVMYYDIDSDSFKYKKRR